MWMLRLLGTLVLEREGRTIRRFRAEKYASLLAFLALNPRRAFSRDELVDLFWPEAEPEAGRACLRTALSALRRQFGDPTPFHEASRNTLQINTALLDTDVASFERQLRQSDRAGSPIEQARALQEALALFTGPLMPGFYDDWVQTERERLEALRTLASDRLTTMPPVSEPTQTTIPPAVSEWESERRAGEAKSSPVTLYLPITVSPFQGREMELTRLESWLLPRENGPRLITLTGTAGIGKSRLAIEAARRAAPRFPGAVCFVPLAACVDAVQIPALVAEALRLPLVAGGDPLEGVGAFLRSAGPSLLVLDNLEQLVEAGAAPVVRSLRAISPDVVILTTSRQPLQIEGEQEFPLDGLTPEDSRHLFAQRATASRPDFAITPRNTAAVSDLCEQLDGIPLAIELCAAWASLLTPSQMAERLSTGAQRFELLVSRRRDIAERHRNLHAALEANCPTDPAQRRFFAACSVFRGGWTLEAARAVTGDRDALSHLAALRERSLLTVSETDFGFRYNFLETIRVFADELLSPEERIEAQRRHCDFFLKVATAAGERVNAAGDFSLLFSEEANIRVAMEWGVNDTPERLLHTRSSVFVLHWHLWVRGHQQLLRTLHLATRLYERRDEFTGADRGLALQYGAELAHRRGDYEEAERLYRETITCYNDAGRQHEALVAQEHLGQVTVDRGDWQAGEQMIADAAVELEREGHKQNVVWVLARLASNQRQRGDFEAWLGTANHARILAREIGDIAGVATLDRDHGALLFDLGRAIEAEPLVLGAADTFRTLGQTRNLVDSLLHLGRIRESLRDLSGARSAFSEAIPLTEALGEPAWAEDIRRYLDSLNTS